MDAKRQGEPINVKPLSESDHLICLVCETEMTHVADLQNPQPLKKGNILICGECATIHKIGDSGLVKFTKEDFKGLDPKSRATIGTTVATILARHQRKNN